MNAAILLLAAIGLEPSAYYADYDRTTADSVAQAVLASLTVTESPVASAPVPKPVQVVTETFNIAPIAHPAPKPVVGPVGTVTVYVVPGCIPCAQLKREVANYTGIAFDYRQAPAGYAAPTLEWDTPGGRMSQVGWAGLAAFVQTYNTTRGAVQKQVIRQQQAQPLPQEAGQAATPIHEVRRVLALLRPQKHEVFVDYGCGDGRWLIEAARTYGCSAIGIEIDPVQADYARRAVAAAGVDDRVRIIEGDALTVQVDAQVGVAYLYGDVLERLKPELLRLNRFATYMHRIDGVAMQQNGDAWLWQRPVQQVQQVQQAQGRAALYEGQWYTSRVCNNPNCAMCAAIARQLGWTH
jgi:SAM-dependent methyltransferase